MGKERYINMSIFELVDDYRGLHKYLIGRSRTPIKECHDDMTLTTFREIILQRYRREIEPHLNFLEQCFVKVKAEQLGIKPEEL